jgi:hypothetical protein
MTDVYTENQRLRSALYNVADGRFNTKEELIKMAEDALKIVPLKMTDRKTLADKALLESLKIHKDRADYYSNTLKDMTRFLKIWQDRESQNGNKQIAEAIKLTIESYTWHK